MEIVIAISLLCLLTWVVLIIRDAFGDITPMSREEADHFMIENGATALMRYLCLSDDDHGLTVEYTRVDVLDTFTDVYGMSFYYVHVTDEKARMRGVQEYTWVGGGELTEFII